MVAAEQSHDRRVVDAALLPGAGEGVGALVELAEGQLAALVDQAECVGVPARGD